MLILEAKRRSNKPTSGALRKIGELPAVFYGRKEKSTPITLSYKQFEKAWKRAGESTVITLRGEWGDKETLIVDTAKDPLTDAFLHADFYCLEKGQKVKVKVPIEWSGVAGAVKDLGGVLLKVLHDLEIETEPSKLPHVIIVDISKLADLNSQLLAKDVSLPSGVKLVTNPDEVVAAIAEAKEEIEEKPAESVDLSSIEISEKRGKEEKEGAPTAGAKPEASTPPKDDKKERGK